MELKLFGGLRLDAPTTGPLGRAGQPRRLAVLALLALTRDRTLRRDQIIPLLWPGRTEDAARRLLSSVVYDLRGVLGEAALEAMGDSLTLKLDSLDIDTLRFDAAMRAGRWGDANALYTGDLLAGIDLEGSAELEQLIDERREHFLSAYAEALEHEAERLAALGETDRAIEAWYRLTEARPYEAGDVIRLARALDARGHRAAGMEQVRRYGDRVRRDLDLEPDPAVAALVAELRSRPEVPPADLPIPARVSNGSGPPAATRSRAAGSLRRRRRLQWLVGIAAVVTLVLARTLGGRNAQHTDTDGVIHLAVFPFVTVGDSEYRYLGDGMTRLLSTDLDGGGRLVTVSPATVIGAVGADGSSGDLNHLRVIAHDLGAQEFVTGTATAKGERLRLTAVMHSTAGTTADPTEVAVEGPAADLPALVDSLSVRLLIGEARPTERLVRVAAATTGSLPALKAYLRGERFFREGAFAAAAGAFDRATRIDPEFALAHYRCSLATLWADLPGTSTAEHDAQAVRYAEHLASRDRELVLAYSAWRRGNPVEAERRYRALWTRYPDDVEAGFQLAETIFHYGPLMGRPIEEARGILLEVLRIDPGHRGARWHLALLEGAPDQRAELRTDLASLAASGRTDVEVRGLSLRIDQRPLGPDSVIRSAAPGQLWSLAWRLAVNLHDFDGAAEGFGLITRRERPVRSMGFRGQSLLRLAQGHWSGDGDGGVEPAVLTLDGLVVNEVFSPPAAEVSRLLASARIALAGIDSSVGGSQEERVRLVSAIGRLSLALHDSSGALAARATLVRDADTAAVHSLDAFLAARAGRFGEALQQLDSARRDVWFGLAVVNPYFGQQAERFLRAEMLLALGRLEEALRWYGGFGEFALDDLPYLARAEQRRAEIYERLGRRAEASSSLQRAAELRVSSPSPS